MTSCFGLVVLWVEFFGFGLVDLVRLGFGRLGWLWVTCLGFLAFMRVCMLVV